MDIRQIFLTTITVSLLMYVLLPFFGGVCIRAQKRSCQRHDSQGKLETGVILLMKPAANLRFHSDEELFSLPNVIQSIITDLKTCRKFSTPHSS